MNHVVCVVLPHLMERHGCSEWEWKFRKLCKVPKHQNSVSWKTVSFFCLYLLSLWKATRLPWELADLLSHVPRRFIRTAFTFIQCFHLIFCLPLPRTGRCVLSLSVAISGTAFMKVSLCCFLIRRVCQRLIECIPKCVWSHPWLKMLLWCHSYKPPYYRNRDIILSTVALKIKSISVLYYLY